MRPTGDHLLVGAAILLHGVIDTATTGLAYIIGLFEVLEGNPIVLEIGFWPWLAVNTVAVLAIIPAYVVGREHRLMRPVLWILVIIGLPIALNVPILVLEVL